jgi:hypothetical protein
MTIKTLRLLCEYQEKAHANGDVEIKIDGKDIKGLKVVRTLATGLSEAEFEMKEETT